MVNTTDPVGQGFVESLSRPGNNITGLSDFAGELSGKRLELLKQALPRASRVAILFDPNHPAHVVELEQTQAAALALGIALQPMEVRTAHDYDGVFARMTKERPDALIVLEGFLNADHQSRILEFTAKNRIPVMSGMWTYVETGGLICYAPNVTEMYRRAAVPVDKILKGAKPGDLPVEQPTKVELVINLKTAKALGLTIPPSLLGRADEVIQEAICLPDTVDLCGPKGK